MSWQDYVVQTVHDGIIPCCQCGCEKQAPFHGPDGYASYRHGHNPVTLSEAGRRSISEKNSVNTARYFAAYPHEGHARTAHMRSFVTPEVTARRIAASRATTQSTEFRQLVSENSKRYWSTHPEKRKQRAETCKRTYHERAAQGAYEETNRLLSEMMVDKLTHGEIIWQRGEYTSTMTGQTWHYKSSYELEAMRQLDVSTHATTWGYECFKVRYTVDGRQRYHVPDFKIELKTGRVVVIEVKPAKLRDSCTGRNAAAHRHCRQNGWSYRMWEPDDGPINDLLTL